METQIEMKPSDYVRKGWCRGTFAMDVEGRQAPIQSPRAVAWCISGAVRKAAREDHTIMEKWFTLIESKIGRYMLHWNDDPVRRKEEVVALLMSVGL
ncbi:MAG: DUF6197 family protein [Rubrobacteraceae bacterium]